jgi:hypothetical protein
MCHETFLDYVDAGFTKGLVSRLARAKQDVAPSL